MVLRVLFSGSFSHLLSHDATERLAIAGRYTTAVDEMKIIRLICLAGCLAGNLLPVPLARTAFVASPQEFLPSPPADRASVYVLDDANKLVALPFESASTPLHSTGVAKETKTSYLEIKGEHAATILLTEMPRWFLFADRRAHPPFLVWLTPRKGARRVTAVAQKGLAGFAIDSEQIVKPSIRVLARVDNEQVFMECRPRISLAPGEYAIIGDDLTRVATFRVK